MPKVDQLSDEEILVKHAFRGSSYAVVRLEELTDISDLKADAMACYRPVNAQEVLAIERIALCQQKMLRGERLESGLFTTALDYCLERDGRHAFRAMGEMLIGDGDIDITRAQNRSFALGEGFRIMVKESDVWSIMLRYQVNAERQYRRAVEDFERLKRLRPEMPNHPDLRSEPEVINDIAPLRELNPIIRVPEPVVDEPAAASPVVPENDSPEDGTPLAPAAAGVSKAQEPTSRVHSSDDPEAGRLKAAPVAARFAAKPFTSPRRRPGKSLPAAPASQSRRSACRPVAESAPPASSTPPAVKINSCES